MTTDYSTLLWHLENMELYLELNMSYPPGMLSEMVWMLTDYLLERDKPKRELILMKDRLKAVKQEVKARTGMKDRKALKKEVKKMGTLKPMKKGAKSC